MGKRGSGGREDVKCQDLGRAESVVPPLEEFEFRDGDMAKAKAAVVERERPMDRW